MSIDGTEAVQLALLSSVEMPAPLFQSLEQRGHYTGARLRAQRPEVYDQCVALLREGVTASEIKEVLSLDPRTIEAVAIANSIPLPTSKRRMAERFRLVTEGLLERAAAAADARDIKDLMIGAGIGAEKWQLLDGQPTGRTVDVRFEVSPKDWNDWIDSAAGNPGANAAGPALDAGDQACAGMTLEVTATDSPSCAGGCGAISGRDGGGDCIRLEAGSEAENGVQSGGRNGEVGGRGGLGVFSAGDPPPDALGGGNFPANGGGAA